MSFLDETGYRHLYQKIVNKVQALWQKVGTATLTTNAKNTSEAINELKQSLDTLVTASRSGYGLTVTFSKLSNIKMVSVVGKPSEELIAGTQYNICEVPSDFTKRVDTVQGRVVANGHKSIAFYNIGARLYITPTDNLATASTIAFSVVYL